jgi:hypothetical protein
MGFAAMLIPKPADGILLFSTSEMKVKLKRSNVNSNTQKRGSNSLTAGKVV